MKAVLVHLDVWHAGDFAHDALHESHKGLRLL